MKQGRIYVDSRGYQGEDLEASEPRQGGLQNGWHNHNSGAQDALKFGDEAMPIVAEINIKSHIDRIFTRLRNGTLKASRIVIEIEDYQL